MTTQIAPSPVAAVSTVRWVDGPEALAWLLAQVEPVRTLAVDTESDGFFRYRGRLCLLQLGWDGGVALVDPLAGLDLLPLWQVLADPRRECILHDAEQDVNLLRRERGVVLGRLFDTCAAARIVGVRQVGLANLVGAELGVALDKKEQRSDWGQRPLRREQLTYAAADVLHLVALRGRLAQRLAALGRADQADQEFERIRLRQLEEKPFDPTAWRSFPEAKTLDAAGRGALEALWSLREALARERDLAPFRLLAPAALVELARQRPATSEALAQVTGVSSRLALGPEGKRLLQALQDAVPFLGALRPPRPVETPEQRAQDVRYEALRTWRTGVAAAWDVDVGVIAPNAVLAEVARRFPRTLEALAGVPDLLPWRVAAFGPALLDVLRQTERQPVSAP